MSDGRMEEEMDEQTGTVMKVLSWAVMIKEELIYWSVYETI